MNSPASAGSRKHSSVPAVESATADNPDTRRTILNKHTVFSGRGGKHSMVKYYALAVVQGLLGAGLVQFLPTVLPISAAVVKIPVDLLLFAASYFIQRDFVFDK